MLDFIQKRLFWLMLAAVAAGLGFSGLGGGLPFTPVICLAAALAMIYPSLVPLEFDKIRLIGRHKRLIAWSLVVNFVVWPFLAWLSGWLFLANEPSLRLGLVLLSVLPGGGMVTAWAYKSRADLPLTVGLVLANLLAAVVLAPFYLSAASAWLAPAAAPSSCGLETATGGLAGCSFGGAGLDPLKLLPPVIVIVIIPLFMAYVTQGWLERRLPAERLAAVKRRFAAVSNLGMLALLFWLLALEQNGVIFERPDLLLRALPAVLLFYAGGAAAAYLAYRISGGAPGRAMFWGSYLRYITLALGLTISLSYARPDLSLAIVSVVLAYLIQIPSSFWLARRLAAEEKAA